MRKTGIIIVLLACALPLLAGPNAEQATKQKKLDMDYRVSFRGGVMTNDLFGNEKLKEFCTYVNPTLGGEFAIAFHPDWQALHEWNDASVGVALSAYYLGNNEKLGYAIAPYTFLDVPLVRVPHFVLGLRLGIGVAFLTKTYFNTADPDKMYESLKASQGNQCIGSVFNFHFPEAIYMEFPIKNGWSILAGGGWYHFSNGSTIQPNTGYNIFCGEIGARYMPNTDRYADRVQTTDHRKKNWEVELAWTGAARQVYYKDRQTFFGFTLQAAAYWRAHNVFRLGGGIDVFYDNSYVPRETKFGKTNVAAARENGADCWRMGLSIQPELVVGKLTCGFHVGAYMIDGVKNLEFDQNYATEEQAAEWAATGRVTKGVFYAYDIASAGQGGKPDGWLYTQLVLRYHLPWHIFIQANMKTHMSKVEFVCLGIGAWL
ncbi:MAG: acyloxyacyl hydrolase [Paludibacteraceae bacterium]|nr:acyloxyacyl hydrolase [Paludibacteraceae bacterium]